MQARYNMYMRIQVIKSLINVLWLRKVSLQSETHSWFLIIPFSIMMEKGTMRNQPWVTDNEVMLKEIKLKVKHIFTILTKKSKQMDGPIDFTHWFTSILIFLHNLQKKKTFMEIHPKRLLWTRIRKVFSTPPPQY